MWFIWNEIWFEPYIFITDIDKQLKNEIVFTDIFVQLWERGNAIRKESIVQRWMKNEILALLLADTER